MPGRIIAIGDIHGYADALEALLAAIEPQADDTLIPLGDYVDRGPDSPRVIEMLIALAGRCQLVPLLGNHDEMLIDLHHGSSGLKDWLSWGGKETLQGYRCKHPRKVPTAHIDFLRQCVTYHEIETHFFVHARYDPELPLDWQPSNLLRWASLRPDPPGPHCSGKIAIVGHTAQRDGKILDLGHLKCIDTACYAGGWLTALDVLSNQVWQADAKGRLREKG